MHLRRQDDVHASPPFDCWHKALLHLASAPVRQVAHGLGVQGALPGAARSVQGVGHRRDGLVLGEISRHPLRVQRPQRDEHRRIRQDVVVASGEEVV